MDVQKQGGILRHRRDSRFILRTQPAERTLHMNHAFRLMLAAMLLSALLLGGCGKKGPLYLPDPNENQEKEPEQQAT